MNKKELNKKIEALEKAIDRIYLAEIYIEDKKLESLINDPLEEAISYLNNAIINLTDLKDEV